MGIAILRGIGLGLLFALFPGFAFEAEAQFGSGTRLLDAEIATCGGAFALGFMIGFATHSSVWWLTKPIEDAITRFGFWVQYKLVRVCFGIIVGVCICVAGIFAVLISIGLWPQLEHIGVPKCFIGVPFFAALFGSVASTILTEPRRPLHLLPRSTALSGVIAAFASVWLGSAFTVVVMNSVEWARFFNREDWLPYDAVLYGFTIGTSSALFVRMRKW